LLEEGIEALIIHARTRKEMSKVPANWDAIQKAVTMRDAMGLHTKIIGNGDVSSIEDGLTKIEKTGCDGVMVGRGIFGNPWFFKNLAEARSAYLDASWKEQRFTYSPSEEERVKALAEHIHLFHTYLEGKKPYHLMKKHYKSYLPGMKKLRSLLMQTTNTSEALDLLS